MGDCVFVCDFLYITVCEMMADCGKECVELEVILFPQQLLTEHLSLINRDCEMPSGWECDRLRSCVWFSVTNGKTKYKHTQQHEHIEQKITQMRVICESHLAGKDLVSPDRSVGEGMEG